MTTAHRLGIASGSCLLLLGTWFLTVRWSRGAEWDAALFAQRLVRQGVGTHTADTLMRATGWCALGVGILIPLICASPWRTRLALSSITPLAVGTARAGKILLPAPDSSGPLGASFPSGHVAAVMAASIVCAIAAPPDRWHRAAAGGLTMAMGVLVVLTGWHRPADVIGAAFVVCVLAASARCLAPGDYRLQTPLLASLALTLLTLMVAATGGVLLLASVLDTATRYPLHGAFLAVMAALCALLVSILLLSVRVWQPVIRPHA